MSSPRRSAASATAPDRSTPATAGVKGPAGRNSTAYSPVTPSGTLRLSRPSGDAASSTVAATASPSAASTDAAATPGARPAPGANVGTAPSQSTAAAANSTPAHETKLTPSIAALPASDFPPPAPGSGRRPKRLPSTAARPSPNAMQNTPSAPTYGAPRPNENNAISVSDTA